MNVVLKSSLSCVEFFLNISFLQKRSGPEKVALVRVGRRSYRGVAKTFCLSQCVL